MWMAWLFWLLLMLPGLALVVRCEPESLQDGVLSLVARAYFASLTLLTPVSVIGYVLHTPVWVLSMAVVLAIAGGVLSLVRMRQRLRVYAFRPSWLTWACSALLVCDGVLGARVGSHVFGDSAFHIGRVRMLLGEGLGSWDVLLPGHQFESTYHTNLYHALLAVSAQLSGLDPGAAWVAMWPVTKLMTWACAYELALRVFGDERCAWIAALSAGVSFVTQSAFPVPNTLCCFALLPFGLACSLRLLKSEPAAQDAAWVGVASLVIAQVHILYAVFLLLWTLPLLGVRALCRVRHKHARGVPLGACGAALASVPWIVAPALPRLISALFGSVAHAQSGVVPAVIAAGAQAKRELFVPVGAQWVRMRMSDFVGWQLPLTQLVLLLALLALLTRRAEIWGALGLMGTAAFYLFVPPVCSLLLAVAHAHWIVARFATTLKGLPAALLVSGVASFALTLASYKGRAWYQRALEHGLCGLGMACALGHSYLFSSRRAPWDVETTWQSFVEHRASSVSAMITERAHFFRGHVPVGAVVMAPLQMDYALPMYCNCRPFAFGHGHHGVKDIAERRAAVEAFYARGASSETRVNLLRKYDLHYVYSSPGGVPRLVRDLRSRSLQVEHASAGRDAVTHVPQLLPAAEPGSVKMPSAGSAAKAGEH